MGTIFFSIAHGRARDNIARPDDGRGDRGKITSGNAPGFWCCRQSVWRERRYPSATSRIIITLKPAAKNTVPTSECSPADISGMSSSTTT